jgi:hypothetical protein
MKEAVSTSVASVNFYRPTWCNIPEDSHLHTLHRENPESHIAVKELKDIQFIILPLYRT